MVGIEIDVEGLEVANEMIEMSRAVLDAAGNLVTGCGLHAKTRLQTSDKNNVEIANYLINASRDFFSVDAYEAEDIADMFAQVVQSMLDRIAKKAIRKAGKGLKGKARKAWNASPELLAMAKKLKGGSSINNQEANNIAAKAYKEAMAKWMHIVSDRITEQTTLNGGSPAPLSEGYARFKRGKFGFEEPIGVATGQLRENFDPSNVGNIRMYRDKSMMQKMTQGLKDLL